MTAVSGAQPSMPRRALATRNAGWPRLVARQLAAIGIRPNAVSVASAGFAFLAGAAFALSADAAGGTRSVLLLAAAASIQLRLLCNLLDGLLAIEEGLKTTTGEIFNDLPDRASDVLILVGAGYAVPQLAFGSTLGWLAAVAALLTAYVRVLGGSIGLPQHFIGPMAKQHRMFALTVGTVLAAAEATLELPPRALLATLALIVAGSLLTTIRRTMLLLREARGR